MPRRYITRSQGWRKQASKEPVQLNVDSSSDSYESAEDSLYKPHMPLDSLDSSSDNNDDVSPSSDRRKRKTASDKDKGKKKVVNDEDTSRPPSMDASDYEKEVDDDENEENLQLSFSDDSWKSDELKTPPDSEDEADPAANPIFNDAAKFGHVRLELGMEFTTRDAFKKGVRNYTLQEGRGVRYKKNDTTRCRVVCKNEDCPWMVFCSYSKPNGCWQIKTFNDDHTCERTFKNRCATRSWVTDILVKKVRKLPAFRHCEVFNYFKAKTGIQLSRTTITRALGDARKIVRGDEAAEYAKLRDYAEELLRSNPGSTVKLGVSPMPNGEGVFERFYVCLHGYKKGFVGGCRPLVGLDGAFLKTYYGGWLLCAMGQDANNHVYPIAWAIVHIENKDNWKWFLELLQEDIGDQTEHGWCFISDMQKGLIPALREVMPGAHHRFCAWHLWQNFQKQWKDSHLKSLLWKCVRAMTVQEFNGHMQSIKRVNEKAWAYLDKFPRQAWTRAHYKDFPKVDNVCNNMCEVFNAATKPYICKPVLTLLEDVRRYAMTSMARNKLKLSSHMGYLPPIQQSRLAKERHYSRYYTPMWSGNAAEVMFEVHGEPHNVVVDLGNQTCSCRSWQLSGLPCRHAIAAISVMNGRPENYVHAWLTMGSYNKTYEYHINPVRGQQLWETSEYLHCLPPVRSKPRGRPSHYARKKDQHEAPVRGSQERTATKLKRKYGKFTCGTCGDVGHTTRSCRISKKQKADELAAAAKAAEDAADKGDTGSKGNKGEVVTEECEVGAEGGQIDTQTEVAAEGGLGDEQEHATKAVKTTKTAKKGHLRTKCERRIDKLPVKRTTSSTAATAAAAPHPTEISRETIQGASAATSEKLASFLKFVPNPGFNPPRKTV
nr:uncharacterized protein LOC112769454 [Arachis hypogaea]